MHGWTIIIKRIRGVWTEQTFNAIFGMRLKGLFQVDFNRICSTASGESPYITSSLVKKKNTSHQKKHPKIKYPFSFTIKEKECHRDTGSMILAMILVKSYSPWPCCWWQTSSFPSGRCWWTEWRYLSLGSVNTTKIL